MKILTRIFIVLTISFVAVLQVSCSSNNISRNEARSLILSSREIVNMMSEINLHNAGFKKGVEHEMWIIRGTLWNEDVSLTEKGKNYFSDIKYKSCVKTINPIGVNVDITGITDAMPGIKEAQFKWMYSDVPSVVKRFIIIGGAGKAYFRKYDDGWRIEEIEVKKSNEAALLSEEEIKQEREELASVKENRQILLEQEKQEKERLSLLINKSKTPTKTLEEFTFQSYDDFFKRKIITNITVTDVNFKVVSEEKSSGGGITSTDVYWYGDIKDLKKIYNNENKRYGLNFQFRSGSYSNGIGEKVLWDSSEDNISRVLKKIQDVKSKFEDTHKEVVQRYLR